MRVIKIMSVSEYAMKITVVLLLVGLLAWGITGTVNAQVSAVSSGGSFAISGPGGSFVGSGTPYIAGGGFVPERMVCQQTDIYGTLVCQRVPAVYRTPGTVIIQSGPYL